MKKRLLALNLVLVLLLTLVPTVSFADGPVVLVPDENGNVYAEYYVNEVSDLTTEFTFIPSKSGVYRLFIEQPQAQPVSGESLALYRSGDNAESISMILNESDVDTRCVLEAGTEYTFSIENNQPGQHLIKLWFIDEAEYVEAVEISSANFPDDVFRQFVASYDINQNGLLDADELVNIYEINICLSQSFPICSLEGIEKLAYTKGIYMSTDYSVDSDSSVKELLALPNGIESLNICTGYLEKLPDLSGYTNLTGLFCAGNNLTELPKLPDSLYWLDCSSNQLTMLPALPDGLQELDCSGNQITEWPELPDSLFMLYCSNNQLTMLPDLPNGLGDLDCSYNELTSLPTLPDSLLHVNCDSNNLTSLPTLPVDLWWLQCSDNNLMSLPKLPDSLWYLICSNNQLTTLPELPKRIGGIDCSGNNLTSIELNPEAEGYGWLDVSNNCLPGKEAVTGQDIVWDEVNFIFGEQRVAEVHTHTTETVGYVAPTCTEDGYTGDEICTVCGETVSTGEVIAATGHSYGDDNTCDNCGHKQSVTEAIQTWISDTIQSIRSFFDKIFGRI